MAENRIGRVMMAMKNDDDDIGQCLTQLGVEKHQIIPTNTVQRVLRQQPELNQFRNEINNIFPLEWFDDGDSDVDFSTERIVEGFAFLPANSSPQQQSLEINADAFEWREVTVEKYNETPNKWRIKELESGAIYEVPRIYLMLIVDKPFSFAKRIQRAVQLRSECENRLKFDAAVDGIILSEFPKPQRRLQDTIRKLLFHPFNIRWIEIFESEHNILYQKTLAASELISCLAKDPLSFPSMQLPTMRPKRRLKEMNPAITTSYNVGDDGDDRLERHSRHETFVKTRSDFQRMWLYCCPEAIKIMEFINNECDDIRRMSLFHIQTTDVCSLMVFVDANKEKYSEISNFFEEKWTGDVVREVKRQLAGTDKGWFKLNVNDWFIYRLSKLSRLIELIKQRMEIAVWFMLRSSLQAFVNHLCRPCEAMLDVAVDFAWGNDLVTSWFPTPQPAVFSIGLKFVGDQPTYTTDIDRFEMEIIEMFKSRILTTHRIPQIDPYLVAQLKFDKGLRLASIGLLDEKFQTQIHHLRRCYQVVLIPLRAYAREYRRFIEFKNLIIPDYVRSLREGNKTSKEMKKELFQQLESIDEIELTVPSEIVIGPFQISVSLKQDLIVKRRDLFRQLLVMFQEKLKEKVAEIKKEYEAILVKLPEKYENVEELHSICEWIPDIPQEVNQIESKMKKLSSDFDVLDSFLVVLSDDVMRLKYSSKMMPLQIQQRVEESQLKQEREFEQFRKLQATHETQFLERIDNIVADVEAYSSRHDDIDDVSRFSCEIDELWGELNEMVARGETLNNRQKIFNQPEIDMERLAVSVQRLHPHHKLWTTVSNFLRSKEAWTFSPLSTIDINEVETEVKRCENVLDDSRRHFASSAEMLVLIGNIFKDFDDFTKKTYDVMRDLKNVDMQDEHWLLLSKRTGIPINDDLLHETSFDSLVAQGVLDSAGIVKEVSQKATHDREAKRLEALDEARKRLEEDEMTELKKARRGARKDI